MPEPAQIIALEIRTSRLAIGLPGFLAACSERFREEKQPDIDRRLVGCPPGSGIDLETRVLVVARGGLTGYELVACAAGLLEPAMLLGVLKQGQIACDDPLVPPIEGGTAIE